MSTHHGGDGGNNVPPEGGQPPDPEFPELPAEWGDITIPDDPSELAAEAEQIQEELLREQREQREERASRASGEGPAGSGEPSIGVPLMIMSVAVLITLVSLFAMAWSGSSTVPGESGQAADVPSELPPITLLDAAGTQVALTTKVPVVLVLMEKCTCDELLSATIAGAPAGVTVAAVGRTAPANPPLEPGDVPPLRLADPNGLVRSQLGLDPPTSDATVVLVDGDRQITATHPVATAFAQFQSDLTDLR